MTSPDQTPEPSEPFMLAQLAPVDAPKKPGMSNWMAAAVGAGIFVLVAGLVVVAAVNANRKPAAFSASRASVSASPSPSISPSPVRVTISASTACGELIPLLTAAVNVVTAVVQHPDMSTVDKAKVESTTDSLEQLYALVPDAMREDVHNSLVPLQQIRAYLRNGGNPYVATDDFKASGLRLAGTCSAYAAPAPPPPPPPPPAPAGPSTSFEDGTWLIGSDIAPGRYRTTVPADSSNCYYARLRNTEGTLSSIITNNNVDGGKQAIVTILKSDNAFESDGCGTWTKIG